MNTLMKSLSPFLILALAFVASAMVDLPATAEEGTAIASNGPIWLVNPSNGNSYALTEPMSWMEAEAQAVQWGGHLATLRSWDEELWIKDTFGRGQHLWIGFNDIQVEGSWDWSSGEPVVYTNWAPGEPNNNEGEDAAVMNWCEDGGNDVNPECLGDFWNDVPAGGGRPGVVERSVRIDIKPGSDPNSINTYSRGVIPVAILTTEHVDALTIDPDSVEFGPDNADKAHRNAHTGDVDGDGDLDLVLHFRTRDTGIAPGDTEACLTGQTYDGVPIQACDSVVTVP